MIKYPLSFISEEDLELHVKDTVIEDLNRISEKGLLEALFKLSFSSYYGWNNKEE